jgi:hypothetical protein
MGLHQIIVSAHEKKELPDSRGSPQIGENLPQQRFNRLGINIQNIQNIQRVQTNK